LLPFTRAGELEDDRRSEDLLSQLQCTQNRDGENQRAAEYVVSQKQRKMTNGGAEITAREVNGLRRRLEDGEGMRTQKDRDGSNRRNSRNEAVTNIKESNSRNYVN
jgi:hypothetical protein